MTVDPPATREWTLRAACRQHPTLPPSTWDGEIEGDRSQKRRQARVAAAKAVCNACPVRQPCEAEVGWAGGIRAGEEYPDRADSRPPRRSEFRRASA